MRSTRTVLVVVLMAAAGLGVATSAHHAEAPFYDMARTVEIRGVVTRWQFRNPHPFLFVEVADEKGGRTEWTIEFVGAVRLAKELGPGHTIVTILCDYGTRYQSKLFNPKFLKERGLPHPDWLPD